MTPSIMALAGCLVLPKHLTYGDTSSDLLAMYQVALLLLMASTVKIFSSEKMSTWSLPFFNLFRSFLHWSSLFSLCRAVRP